MFDKRKSNNSVYSESVNEKMASRWLPNIEEFFEALLRLIETAELLATAADSCSYDAAEFHFRRLDAYERTLSTLRSRVAESLNWEMSENTTTTENVPAVIAHLCYICHRTSFLRQRFEDIFYRSIHSEREAINDNQSLGRSEQVGPGRPRFAMTREQLEALNNCSSGFRWSEISRAFGVSERTLRRRRHELGMTVEGRQFSDLSDTQLDTIVRAIIFMTPNIGYRMLQGALRHRGLHVQRERILRSMHRVDPVISTLRNTTRIIRRSYNVPCPNALW